MAIIRNLDIKVLNAPGAIFDGEITTDKVKLDNGQAAHFVVTTGEGALKVVTANVYAVKENKEPVMLQSAEIKVGASSTTRIVIAARELSRDEMDSVYLVIPSADADDINGSIFVVLTNERYKG